MKYKAVGECVSFNSGRYCDEDKQMVIDKQNEIERLTGRRIGKAKAVKELLNELREYRQKNGDKEIQ